MDSTRKNNEETRKNNEETPHQSDLDVSASRKKTEPPLWFLQSLNPSATEFKIGPPGRQINVRYWDFKAAHKSKNDVPKNQTNPADESSPDKAHSDEFHRGVPVILIHGFLAHAHWYDFIAPHFCHLGPVYALDLPGMGDSDHLTSYRFEDYIQAIDLIVQEQKLEQFYLASHSFGSLIALNYAYSRPDLVKKLILADVALDPKGRKGLKHQSIGGRYYPDREKALSRFRLIPPQDCPNDFILDYIAQHSIRKDKLGWRWKFDWNLGGLSDEISQVWAEAFHKFKRLTCPCAFVYGAQSRVCTTEWLHDTKQHLEKSSIPARKSVNFSPVFIEIQQAGHHLLLDQPLAFAYQLCKFLEKDKIHPRLPPHQ